MAIFTCATCDKQFEKFPSQFSRNKSELHFCSRKCAAQRQQKALGNLTCSMCGKEFYRKPSELEKNKTSFCSPNCHKQFRAESRKLHTFTCGQCGETVRRYLADKDLRDINFCSRSCSASFNNKLKPKRKPEGKCRTCGDSITSGRTFCVECQKKHREECIAKKKALCVRNQKTLGEAKNTTGRPANLYSGVRFNARAEMVAAKIPKVCAACGYSKHVQCCHKKAISSFPPETLIGVVNALSNLVWLCPNCHWEFDHGQLEL